MTLSKLAANEALAVVALILIDPAQVLNDKTKLLTQGNKHKGQIINHCQAALQYLSSDSERKKEEN